MSHHLILLSIGPVQSFIAQARKLLDLRSGSQLLSDLIKASIQHFRKSGGEIIVPGAPDSNSLPNRMLGTVAGLTDEQAINLALELADSVKTEWETIRAEVWKQLPAAARNDKNWKDRYLEQLNQLLETYWAVEPYSDLTDYSRAYGAIEARLGGVKNVRAFDQIGSQFGGDETSRKDALTGERDALLFGQSDKSKYPAHNDHQIAYRLPEQGALTGPNEGLSAVSAVKRLRPLDRRDDLHSTADVAIMGVVRKLARKEGYSYTDYYDELRLSNKQGDGQLVYAENLTKSYFEAQGLPPDDLSYYRRSHKKLAESLRDHHLKQTSYYAVLAFDSDNMGSWLSGKQLGKDVAGDTLKKFHQQVGKYLADFASQARKLVDEAQHGLTIYAGGDDYLGMLSLDSLFDVLEQLRLQFKTTVSDPLREEYSIQDEFTFSAGVVIAHYKRPLGDTIQLARTAEEAAKDHGRNALCLRVVKRSGEQQQTLLPWAMNVEATALHSITTLRELTTLLQGRFGRTWLTESARTVYQLFGKGEISEAGLEMLYAELGRLLRRTLDSGGGVSPAQWDQASAHLRQLVNLTAKGKRASGRNLVHALQLIDFCKREMNPLEPITAQPVTA